MHPIVPSRAEADGLLPPGLARSDVAWRASWREALGSHYALWLALLAIAAFIGGASLPLADPDLPMHLATGEWIVRHGALPVVEPFAWSRAGAPYYAYSWLLEVVYFWILQSVGPGGLQALHGLTFALIGASVFPLGRSLGWNAWTTLLMAAGNVLVASLLVPYLRPHAVLFALLPLAWAGVYRVREGELRWAAALFLVGTIAVNTHLFFPLTAAPLVLLLTHPPAWRRSAVAVGALALGWLATPNLPHLIDIFVLNFSANAFLRPPVIIVEFLPGFQHLVQAHGGPGLFAIVIAAMPWIVGNRMTQRERVLYGVIWLVGLVGFASAVRLIAVWWLGCLPLIAAAVNLLPGPSTPLLLTAQRALTAVLGVAAALQNVEEARDPWLRTGGIESRVAPHTMARSVEPILRWLDCNVRDRRPTRVVTIFSVGSYLPWRSPWLSESIDGRTIFPDSVTSGEGYLRLPVRQLPTQAYRSADVAVMPVVFPLAGVLDTATGWRKLALSSYADGPARMVGLWVRERWWREHAERAIPATIQPLYHEVEADPAVCQGLLYTGGER